MQSINDLGLYHQFLAREVTTVESALREGEARLLANQMHRNNGVSRQVKAEVATTHNDTGAATPRLPSLDNWPLLPRSLN